MNKGAKLITTVLRKSFTKNMIAVASGTAAGQLIAIALSPAISRLYTPEMLGIQGIFISVLALAGPIVTLRLPMAIVIAEDDNDVYRIVRTTVLAALISSITSLIALLLIGEPIRTILDYEGPSWVLLFLPIAFLMLTFLEISDYLVARTEQFKIAAYTSIGGSLISNGLRVVTGLIQATSANLSIITSLAPGLNGVLNVAQLKYDIRPIIRRPNIKEALQVVKDQRQFVLFRAPNDLINAASQSLPVILLSVLFSPYITGLYVLARTVINLPSVLIGTASGNVLYARFIRAKRNSEPLLPYVAKSTAVLFLAASLMLVPLTAFFPSLFSIIFGEEWRAAGVYGQWMVLWIIFAVANTPVVRVAPVIKKQQLLLVLNVCMLLARLASLIVPAMLHNDPLVSIILFSIVSAAFNVVMIGVMLVSTRKFDKEEVNR